MEDLGALIERQKAEQATREAQPGRYDGVTLEGLAHRIEMEAMGLAALRGENDAAPAVDSEARLRAVAATNPRAAAAFGLLNQGVPVIVPLDPTGAPLAPPTRDPDMIASWYESPPYEGCWPGVPCGEQGRLFGLLISSAEGADWFKQVATVHRPTRVERLLSAFSDRVDELGVPGRGNAWDDEEQSSPDEVRASVHARLWLCEDLPAHRAVLQAWTGSLRGAAGQAALAAARPAAPRQLSAMVWSWPAGRELPVGRELREGVLSLTAIPAQGAELVLGGIHFVVRQVPVLLSPPPDWLIDALQELA
jgi:hypothetical protein